MGKNCNMRLTVNFLGNLAEYLDDMTAKGMYNDVVVDVSGDYFDRKKFMLEF